ncbi:enolase C-terminal domain-like protein [Cladorrhinum sp. PSN332]|nr:enolase C-terminal domain-like protein [Cladorrhinum sp. PSN332]
MAAPDLSSITITSFTTRDVRFPTSLDKTGSDAMNAAGDYSAAYCILHTNSPFTGHGMTFTIGRGNDLVCSAISHLAPRILNTPLSALVGPGNLSKTWRHLTSDSQLRWIGPEKGVIHLALGAVVNALWDLWAKILQKPVWRLVCDMTPEELVSCIDFRYITDAITPEEAIALLKQVEAGKEQRMKEAEESKAVPAYTTSAGWLGYDEAKMRRLLRETVDAGYRYFKIKVGGSLEQDKRRLTIAREIIGSPEEEEEEEKGEGRGGGVLMVDANQVWSVPEAIEYMKELAEFKPWFIEEPTSPDDILGHKAIREALKEYGIGVATGEMCQNRVIFKQLLASHAIDVCQIDACRLGGVNEVLAVLLMAKKYGVPVVPHSGGVGLPEYTQHLSTIDYVVVSGKKSVLEYVDHLHEHFVNPAVIKDGYYQTPREPGYSVEMKAESMERYEYPGAEEGKKSWWRSEEARNILPTPPGRRSEKLLLTKLQVPGIERLAVFLVSGGVSHGTPSTRPSTAGVEANLTAGWLRGGYMVLSNLSRCGQWMDGSVVGDQPSVAATTPLSYLEAKPMADELSAR